MPPKTKSPAVRKIRRTNLNGRWTLTGAGPEGVPVDVPARVPGVVHWDLERARIIPNPFDADNELACQWVAQQPWTYTLAFRGSPRMLSRRHVDLVFQGLDTYAEITLNGEPVGKTDNMFIPHRFDVTRLVESGDNKLVVTFLSPLEEGARLHRESPSVKLYEADRNPRPYTRKAQYSYGWDWGPKITTSGIWRDVYLESWDASRIDSVCWRTAHAGADRARVEVTVDVAGSSRAAVEARLCGRDETLHLKLAGRKTREGARFTGAFDVENPLLWWPAGQGRADLYDAEVALKSEGLTVDKDSRRIGLRTVGLKRRKDDEGETFIVTVNGREIFCKGANWIPADVYLPRLKARDYDDWVRLAADANMNMLRVWGGGIYESPEFYRACDRHGIMVWQDFPFACAMYPEDNWFLKSVEHEARLAVKALRNFPSIVLWCGNNENHWAARSWWPGDSFGGRTIYNKILPSVVRRYDPSRPYWPGSPFGGKDPNSESQGDRHSWAVSSEWKDYSLYLQDKGRFISEFGFQAAPPMETVAHFGPLAKLHPQHPLFEFHNKQLRGPERVACFLAGTLPVPRNLDEFVHYTQIVQAEAVKTGVLHWRSRMMKTAGALYWQLNDCWPVTSWSSVDYARRPKGLYYYSKRFFAPLAVRVSSLPDGVHAWIVNDSPEPVSGEIAVGAFMFDGAETGCVREDVNVPANGVHHLGPFTPELLGVADVSRQFIAGTFKAADGLRTRDVCFLVRPKHLALPNPQFQCEVHGADGSLVVTLTARRFAYGVYLRLPGTPARFSDNFLTLLPGETVELDISRSRLSPAKAAKKLTFSWVRGGL